MSFEKTPLNQWPIEVLDHEQAKHEKGWEQTTELSPAERIALIEHLRMMWHGKSVINARVSRVFKLVERAPR